MDRKDFLKRSSAAAMVVPFCRTNAQKDELVDNAGNASARLVPLKEAEKDIHILSNFHPASCGWLADFSLERNYCANSYLYHLDRVDNDPEYRFVLSEVNNMIAIKNFRPKRFEDLKNRVQEGRVEAANAFFLECTVNLSGGEALVKQGVEGLRWQEQVLGVRPRFLWMIDITGMHQQMAQITKRLGLDAYFYCRDNPTESTMQWLVSPDGSSTLGISAGHYSDWWPVYRTKEALSDTEIQELEEEVLSRLRFSHDGGGRELTPDALPYLVLGGGSDYSLAPKNKNYPSEFIQQWKRKYPDQTVQFSLPNLYIDQVQPLLKERNTTLPVVEGGFPYSRWKSFWIELPKVKQKFRASEHLLQTSEALATIQSFENDTTYPTQKFYHAWLQLLLNMDRNTLWGAAGGMVYEDEKSWDANDRFNWINTHLRDINQSDAEDSSDALSFFNSCNWQRKEPLEVQGLKNKSLKGTKCQHLEGDKLLCMAELPSVGKTSYKITNHASLTKSISLPDKIETQFYTARVDALTGDLESLVLKSSGQELLDGGANCIVPERPDEKINFVHHMVDRDQRHEIDVHNTSKADIQVFQGAVATIVKVKSPFLNNRMADRKMIFYHDYPRIDFETDLHNIPNKTVISAEFPFRSQAKRIRRGIPYGFTEGAWPDYDSSVPGTVQGITPAIRWSDYVLKNNHRIALFDRGLPGREYDGKNALLFLMSASDTYLGYQNNWLSGEGDHHFEYALWASDEAADPAVVPREAFAYNTPVVTIPRAEKHDTVSFVKTSSNVIMHAFRREDDFIELRLVETAGKKGEGFLEMNLPHESAHLTNMVGKPEKILKKQDGRYHFLISPQQIVTLRFKTADSVDEIETLTDWTPLVPERKRPALHHYKKDVKGHPPKGY